MLWVRSQSNGLGVPAGDGTLGEVAHHAGRNRQGLRPGFVAQPRWTRNGQQVLHGHRLRLRVLLDPNEPMPAPNARLFHAGAP